MVNKDYHNELAAKGYERCRPSCKWHWEIRSNWRQLYTTSSFGMIGWMFPRGMNTSSVWCVLVSAWTGTSLHRGPPPHPSLWCCCSSTICQPELSHCASLSTQHVRLSGVQF